MADHAHRAVDFLIPAGGFAPPQPPPANVIIGTAAASGKTAFDQLQPWLFAVR
jgi:hypothetical protein